MMLQYQVIQIQYPSDMGNIGQFGKFRIVWLSNLLTTSGSEKLIRGTRYVH